MPLTPYLEWAVQLTPSVTPSAVTDTDPITLPYGFVRPLEDTLTEVDLQLPVRDTLINYALRDAELGHRDVVASVLAAKLLYAVAGAWGVNVQKLIVPFQPVDDDPVYNENDQAYDLYARITHLTGADVVAAALRVDRQCYNRDHLIYRAVADISAALDEEVRPTSYAFGGAAQLYWSPANGLVSNHTVSLRPWGKNLFNDPDRNLAYRDDVVARAVAVAGRIIREGYRHVTRVSAAVWENGIKTRENETYVKVSEDSRYVDFAAFPRLQGANLLRYDKKANRIQYVHANGPLYGTGPYINVGKSGGWLDATGTLPATPDSQRVTVAAGAGQVRDSAFWAQKAVQLTLSPNAEISVVDATGWTEGRGRKLSRRNQFINFTVPASVPAGTYAVYVDFTPQGTRMAPLVPMYVRRAPKSVSDAYYASYAEVATYPDRRDVMAATYVRTAAATEVITIGIDYPNTDAEYEAVYDEGVASRDAGTSYTQNPYGSDAAWQRRAWRDGYYSRPMSTFDKGTVLYVNGIELRRRYRTRVTPNASGFGGVKAECLARAEAAVSSAYDLDLAEAVLRPVFETLIGVLGKSLPAYRFHAENPHAARYVADLGSTITVTDYTTVSDYVEGAKLILWPSDPAQAPTTVTIASVELVEGMLRVSLTTAVGYASGGSLVPKTRAYRFALKDAPTGIVIDEYTGVMSGTVGFDTATGSRECRVLVAAENLVVSSTPFSMRIVAKALSYDYTWDARATEGWMEMMANGREPRIRSAFRVGRAGDTGRPALVPSGIGLQRDGTVSSAFRTAQSRPVLSVFEPWMMNIGIYVCVDSFWSPPQAMRRIDTGGDVYVVDRADADGDADVNDLVLLDSLRT